MTPPRDLGDAFAQSAFGYIIGPPTGMGPFLSPEAYPGAEQLAMADHRTVYLGNLAAGTTVEDVLNHVRSGLVEYAKILHEKSCAFVTFVEAGPAQLFHDECAQRGLCVLGQAVKVGWGKPLPPVPVILEAVAQGASRCIFVGSLEADVTEAALRAELARFGPIDQVKALPEKRIAFVHMCGIASALRAVAALSFDEKWAGRRINYGRDRCALQRPFAMYPVPNHIHGHAQMLVAPQAPPTMGNYPPSPGGNRCVYLGGLSPETTARELCDNVRGGILEKVKVLPDKGIGFVTFMSSDAAAAFHHRSSIEGLVVRGRRLKIGWGRGVPIPAHILAAVQAGATRTVYVGGVDPDLVGEEGLRSEFGALGEVEMVNIVRERGIGFVSFTDIQNAIRAVEAKRADPNYQGYRINYGKDRCANPPKPTTVGSVITNMTAALVQHDHGGGGPRDGGAREGGPRDGAPRDGGPRNGGPRDGGHRDGRRDGGPRDGGPCDGRPRDGAPRHGREGRGPRGGARLGNGAEAA